MVNDYIFLKLNKSNDIDGNEMDGHETIEAYRRNEEENGFGYTWFSTDAASRGMKEDRVKYYNQLAKRGEEVTILFAVADEDNDICYSATVLEVQSDEERLLCPGDVVCIPKEFNDDETAKLWIKIKDIREENDLTAEMLSFRRTGSNVKQKISHSQCIYGFVYLSE